MYRRFLFAAFAVSIAATGCKKESSSNADATVSKTASTTTHSRGAQFRSVSDQEYSSSISVTLADEMIESYLTSVDYPNDDNALRSLVFDADVMRAYLADPSITTVKFMLAHQPAYLEAGNYGLNSGMNPDALTMVLVGVDNSGNYVLNSQGGVFEHFRPCPNDCDRYGSKVTIAE